MTNERLERLLEQLQEDERLRGDLEDDAASALLAWASDRVRATATPQRADADVAADVEMIRTAARRAARSGLSDPTQIIAQAEQAWTLARGQAAPPVASANTPAPIPLPVVMPANTPAPGSHRTHHRAAQMRRKVRRNWLARSDERGVETDDTR